VDAQRFTSAGEGIVAAEQRRTQPLHLRVVQQRLRQRYKPVLVVRGDLFRRPYRHARLAVV
jgi:hypothetical protein